MGRGQLLQQALGGCQGHWNGTGLVARIGQRCPSPAFPSSPRLSLLHVEAGEEQLPMAALLALVLAEGPGPVEPSSQWPAASSHSLRDSLSHGAAPGLSPFPTARHTGHGVPGNFVQFPSSQGLWGKPEAAEAALHGRAPQHPVPGRAGPWSLQRGMCTAQHQAGGGCLPTASTFAGTSDREMSPCQPGPAQHYTYCFLEAELPGRLPSFSSGAEASAGRGVKGSDRGLLPLPSARFSSLR